MRGYRYEQYRQLSKVAEAPPIEMGQQGKQVSLVEVAAAGPWTSPGPEKEIRERRLDGGIVALRLHIYYDLMLNQQNMK